MLIAFPRQKWLHERVSMLRYSTLSLLCIMLSVGEYRDNAFRNATVASVLIRAKITYSVTISTNSIQNYECITQKMIQVKQANKPVFQP
jgi:hypothetical protein